MAKFAFIVPPLNGHINPTLCIGTELLKRGHTVAWICFDPDLGDRLPEGGIYLLISPEQDLIESERERLHAFRTKKIYGIDSLKFLYEEVLNPMNEYMLDKIETIIDSYAPDVIITDQQVYAGAVAAIRKGIPYVTSVTAPAAIKKDESFPMIYEWEGQQVINFQKKMGVEIDTRVDCSTLLSLVYSSKEFLSIEGMPDYYKFIGPMVSVRPQSAAFDWDTFHAKGGNRPKVLVSIGTTFDYTQKLQFFEKVMEAFEGEEITVIVVSDPELFDHIPDNFLIYKHIPQLEILPHLQAVVCHGGHNTVCESLSHGIPLVVLPIAYDQSYVAGCVANNNAGIRINFNRFKAPQLKEAVLSVLNEETYKNSAMRIKKSFEDAGGVNKGIEYLENLL